MKVLFFALVLFFISSLALFGVFFGPIPTTALALILLIIALIFLWPYSLAAILLLKDARTKRNYQIFLVLTLAVLFLVFGKIIWWQKLSLTGSDLLSESSQRDILQRRRFLVNRVAHANFGPADIPPIFGSPFREELAISTLSMTTLALTNIAFLYPETQVESKLATKRMIEAMLTDRIRRFEVLIWGKDPLNNLQSEKGNVGYLGHLHLMLGCYRLLGGGGDYDALHEEITKELVRRMRESPSFHIETSPGKIFTADNTILIASLKLYNFLHGLNDNELVQQWILYTKENLLDKKSGLIRYYVDKDGRAYGTPRGVLQAWNSIWLPIIDKDFARNQYYLSKALLADELQILKLGGMREYPLGITGPTDIIAGPIVAGISSSATGFILAGARWWKDIEYLDKLLRTIEFIGSTIYFNDQRTYLFSPLVGDAIVLAAMTMTEWDKRYYLQ